MSRNLSPKCKMCRREGKKLFLKGERCYTPKCAIIKRKYPPGVHGPKGYGRISEYGSQLREKQKLKRYYGIVENQLKKYFNKAKKSIRNTEFEFLKQLEMRLDSVLFSVGFAVSRQLVRQMISHGHILVNNRKVKVPSYQVKVDDVIKLNDKSHLLKHIAESFKFCKDNRTIPAWLNLDDKKLEIKVIKSPTIDDLPKDINSKLIIEFYSR